MKRWTRNEDARLVACTTDEAMVEAFPAISLSTLQRRRRLLRQQPQMSEGVSLGLNGLERTRFNPRDFSAIIVGDLQSPFVDHDALAAFNSMLGDLGTVHPAIDVLIDNGDHYDNYAISRYKKTEGRGTPEAFVREVTQGTAIFEEWRRILGPDVDIVLHKGNHEVRWDAYLETQDTEHLYAIMKVVDPEALTFEHITGLDKLGIITVPYMKPTLYGDVIVTHGTKSSQNAGMTVRNAIRGQFGTNVVLNHIHTGAMVAQRYIGGTVIGIENFTMADLDGLGYAEWPNWVQGFTYMKVVDGVSYLRPVVMRNQCFEFDGVVYTPRGRGNERSTRATNS